MLYMFLSLLDTEEEKTKFEKIYYRYRRQMFILAEKILDSKEDAEDVVHDVFMKIAVKYFKTVDNIDNPEDLRNYLLKATQNTAINLKKKKFRELKATKVFQLAEKEEIINYSDDAFISEICNKLDYDTLLNILNEMSETYRDVLYFHYVLGMNVKATAETLGRKALTVKKQLVRGKRILIEQAEKRGMEYADQSK